MENGTIRTLYIKDIMNAGKKIDYVDEDFFVATSINDLSYGNEMVRLGLFMIVICMEGRIQMDINEKTYMLQSNDGIICLPTQILSQTMFSPQHKFRILGFSTNFMQRTIKNEKDTGNIFSHVYKNPILHFDTSKKEESHGIYYGELFAAITKMPPFRYRKEILQHLFAAMLYELLAYLYKFASTGENENSETFTMKRANYVFRNFLSELYKDGGKHRSVSYYADKLCYSPKYVSSVVKQVSGRTALDWINENTVSQVKYLLKHSDKSIKEISDMLEFSNPSFFGKYFKAQLGMSPQCYRNSVEE